jgi:acetyl-CoA C-acetyltransferase
VALGMQQIMLGRRQHHRCRRSGIDVDGPACAMHLRNGVKMGAANMVDTMMHDALTDAFYNYLMGNTAENVAKQWQLSRDEQDAFAVASQNKAEAAQKAGKFKDEIAQSPSRAARATRSSRKTNTSSMA